LNIKFIEASAKANIQVDDAFYQLSKMVCEKLKNKSPLDKNIQL
jgi:hypothetical protein